MARLDEQHRRRPLLRAREVRAVGEDEPRDRRAGRRVEPEDVGILAPGREDPAAAAPRGAVLSRRVDALLEEPALGRADDVSGTEGAGEVGAADEDVGARAGRARRDGERRDGQEEGGEWLLHGGLEAAGEADSPPMALPHASPITTRRRPRPLEIPGVFLDLRPCLAAPAAVLSSEDP